VSAVGGDGKGIQCDANAEPAGQFVTNGTVSVTLLGKHKTHDEYSGIRSLTFIHIANRLSVNCFRANLFPPTSRKRAEYRFGITSLYVLFAVGLTLQALAVPTYVPPQKHETKTPWMGFKPNLEIFIPYFHSKIFVEATNIS